MNGQSKRAGSFSTNTARAHPLVSSPKQKRGCKRQGRKARGAESSRIRISSCDESRERRFEARRRPQRTIRAEAGLCAFSLFLSLTLFRVFFFFSVGLHTQAVRACMCAGYALRDSSHDKGQVTTNIPGFFCVCAPSEGCSEGWGCVSSVGFAGIFRPLELNFESLGADLKAIHRLDGRLCT